MDFKQGLHLGQRLEQRLVMTQQLQQAIKLLQLSRAELVDSIQDALAENPLLEEAPAADMQSNAPESGVTSGEGQIADLDAPAEPRQREEIDWQSYFTDLARGPSEGMGSYSGSDEERPPLGQTLTRASSLSEYLQEQLGTTNLTPAELGVAEELIGNLDDDGYFRPSRLDIKGPELARRQLGRQADQEGFTAQDDKTVLRLLWLTDDEMAAWQELTALKGCTAEAYFGNSTRAIAAVTGTSVAEVERILVLVRALDPPGVASQDLRECLLSQALIRHPQEKRLHRLIEEFLPLLEQRNHALIRRELRLQPDELHRLLGLLGAMEPRPGRGFVSDDARYITPDVYVMKIGEDYTVVLNEDGMPRLRVSDFYKHALSDDGHSQAKEYLQEKMRAATWMIRSIHQRQSTIQKVTESIMRHQRSFLDFGIEKLRPLVLREIAEDIGLHESTVSRVTTNKYVHTPQGIFELKYFFGSRIESQTGEDMAAAAVKQAIKKLIDREPAGSPLSDQDIAEILQGEWNRDRIAERLSIADGQVDAVRPSQPMNIARRTVAKYREAIGIESSSRRRKSY